MSTALLILPVISIIILGWISAASGYISKNVAGYLIDFVMKIATPALLFIVLSQETLSRIFYWPFILAFGGGAIIFFVIAFAISKIMGKKNDSAALMGLAASQSSASFVALPVLLVIIGHKAVLPIAISVFILLAIVLPIGVILIELRGERSKSHIKALLGIGAKIIRNPIIIATLLGILWAAISIPVPSMPEKFLHLLADAVTPCALFAVGLNMNISAIKKSWRSISVLAISKLIALPALVMLFCFLLNVSNIFAISAVLISAVPLAKIVYMLSSSYKIDSEYYAAATAATEVGSVITLFLWVMLVMHIW